MNAYTVTGGARAPYSVSISAPTSGYAHQARPELTFCGRPAWETRARSRGSVCSTSAVGGGGSDVLDKPTMLPGLTPKKNRQKKRPPMYKVLLHNDDYNKREYVVQVLLKHVEGFTVEEALNVMREAHLYGIALVIECSQDKAETTCEAMRLCGLISTIEPRG